MTTWEDRIVDAVYTAPSGRSISFDFERFSASTSLRGTTYEFAGVDGAYVQQAGLGPRSMPVRAIFAGADCDRLADTFEALLLERGTGRLQHPVYGTHDVVPTGSVERTDELVEDANQVVVEVTFLPTLGAVYPSVVADVPSTVAAGLADVDVQAAESFARSVDTSSATRRAVPPAVVRAGIQLAREKLALAGAGASAIESVSASILALDAEGAGLASDPATLALRTLGALRAPSLAPSPDIARAYAALITSIASRPEWSPASLIGGGASVRDLSYAQNAFVAAELVALGALAGIVSVAASTPMTRRVDTVALASSMLSASSTLATWRDAQRASLAAVLPVDVWVDASDAMTTLWGALSLALDRLVSLSYSLARERSIVLDRGRTIVDVAAELYGSVSGATLDALIVANDLTGSEILELREGKRIVYHA